MVISEENEIYGPACTPRWKFISAVFYDGQSGKIETGEKISLTRTFQS